MKNAIWNIEKKTTNIRIGTTSNWLCPNGDNPTLKIGNCGGNELDLGEEIIFFSPRESWDKYVDLVGLSNNISYDEAIFKIADYLCSMNGCSFLLSSNKGVYALLSTIL